MGFFRPAEGAILITGAQQSRQDEMKTRQRHYSYTMAFRTISFVLAATLPMPVWLKILIIGGAIIVPWTAVTAANAGPKQQKKASAYDPGMEQVSSAPLHLDPATVVQGSVVTGTVSGSTGDPR